MTQKTPQQALAAYEELYKNPRTGEYIIDGDEAQVAADLAAIVRALPQHPFLPEHPINPTRVIESRRAGGAMFVQLAGTDEEQLQLVDSLREELEQKIPGQPQREQLAAVAAAVKPQFVSAGLVDLDADDYAWDAARAALAALTDEEEAPLSHFEDEQQ